MRSKIFSLLPVAILLIFAPEVSAQDQAPAPAFKEGDFWHFKVTEKDFLTYSSDALAGTYELSYSQGKIKGFVLTGDKKEEIELNPDRPTGSLLVLLGLKEDRQDLKFPLSVGQKWDYNYRFRPITAKREQSRSVEIRVVGIEEITTPAGKLQVFKIERDEGWTQGGGPQARQEQARRLTTYFYSPAAKSIVKSSMKHIHDSATREIELIKYGSSK